MATAAAKAMNTSGHTMAALKRFAKADPELAQAYLKQVETNLRELGKPKEAAAIRKVLTDKTGTLVERIAEHAARLDDVFPTRHTDWAKVQLERAESVGYGVPLPNLKAPSYLTGTLANAKDGSAVFKTAGGQQLKLNASDLRVASPGLSVTWVAGFKGDGAITLQGTPSEDRESFNVEGFALNTDGKFDKFTFGRVVSGEDVHLSTPRGDVTIENPELRAKLKAMPRLGIILPGEPELRGDKRVYTGNPEEFFGLARWRETTTRGTGPRREANVDMAYSVFSNKPLELPAKQAGRASHQGRMWARGNVQLDGTGVATKFVCTYVSKQTDLGVQFGAVKQNADPVQAAVFDEVV